jgi:hypothetical protein
LISGALGKTAVFAFPSELWLETTNADLVSTL